MQAPPALAAVNAPPAPQQLAAPIVHPTSYHGKYTDLACDPFNGNYINFYHDYVGGTPPAVLRNAIYRDGNVGTLIHILAHIRDPNANADDPGLIVAYHRLTRHDTRYGQVPKPYDGLGLAFFGDVQDGHAPTTVTIPDNMFNLTVAVQTPSIALLHQELNADPLLQRVGPYLAGTADVDPIVSRQIMVVPNRYAAPFLTTGMAPRQAFLALEGMIQQEHQDIACAPLLDWLRLTLTTRAGAQTAPVTCVNPLTGPAFYNPQDQQEFAAYRISVMHQDFPQLRPGQLHNSAVLIAQGISDMTSEQRLARQEAQQQRALRDAKTTPAEHFGLILPRIMRLCQVASEADLPPIYAEIANTKKGKIRLALQTALEDTLGNLKYVEDFPVSTTLSTKMVDISWHSNIKDNFSIGLNLFCLGTLDPSAMEDQRRLNHHADTISGGSANPSLLDVATLQDSKQDIYVPRSLAQLRFLVERAEAVWQVLLGSHHPVTRQHHLYRERLIADEQFLERVTPRDPSMLMLVPALLGRVVQLEVNEWITTQLRTDRAVPFDSLLDVFSDLSRERPWEPTFPLAYIHQPAGQSYSLGGGQSVAGSLLTAPTAAMTISRSAAPSSGAASFVAAPPTVEVAAGPPNNIIRNVMYKDTLFGVFKAMGIKSRTLKDNLKLRHIETPTNARGTKMCITYHVVGVCNERCKFAADHFAHNDADDTTFQTWCTENYKIVE